MGDVVSEGEGRVSNVFVLRLKSGADLKGALTKYAAERGVRAGMIVTCVGSLAKAALRYAGKSEASVVEGDLEIVSMTGTLGLDGMHIHLAVSDPEGRTFGGHLVEGSIVRTTSEIAIAEIEGLRFEREADPQTGYRELRVEPSK